MSTGYDAGKDHVQFKAPLITTTDRNKATIEVYVAHYDGADTSWKVATVRRYTDYRGKECVDGKPGRLNVKDAGEYASALLVCAEFIRMNEKTGVKPQPVTPGTTPPPPAKLPITEKAMKKPAKEDAGKKAVPVRGSQWGKKKSTAKGDDDI